MAVRISDPDEFDYYIDAWFGQSITDEHVDDSPDESVQLTVHGYQDDKVMIRVEPQDWGAGDVCQLRFVYFSVDEALNLAEKLIERVRWHRHLQTTHATSE